jgi:ABC-type Zn uptake system ZnuABC Zn-binding protein ZnuA
VSLRRAVPFVVLVLAGAFAACSDDDVGDGGGTDEGAADTVVVPNSILAELVDRVACVDPVEVVVGVPDDGIEPVLELTLDAVPRTDDHLVLSVAAAGDAIDSPRGVDPWVWTDPIRYRQVAEVVAAALVTETGAEPDLVDRCIARLDTQMAALDEELFAALGVLGDEARVLDIDPPGALYFATRYEFAPSQLPAAVDAAAIVSVDELGEAADYESLMRSVVDDLITTLG